MNQEASALDVPNPDGLPDAVAARTVFAAFALHRLLAGVEDPEQRFSQMADGYSEVCTEAWAVADRMIDLRPTSGKP